MNLKEMLEKKKEKRAAILEKVENSNNIQELRSLEKDLKELIDEIIALQDMINEGQGEADYQSERTRAINGEIPGVVISGAISQSRSNKEVKPMGNEIELRSIQKFLTTGMSSLTDTEQRALNISGSAAVLPVEVQNHLITSNKYSDLLHRATVFNQGGAGKLNIPIASNTAASWKVENTDKIGGDSIEASPTLTKIELGGYELMRLMQMSAAASSMTVGGFESLMLELLGSEVIETLEKSFISGSGTNQPKGLDSLTWTSGTNQILTASAATEIVAADIAKALSLLPQKYARNAIILMNSDMLYKVSQFKGTQEYAYNMADGATTFLGKEIVVSEHMADDTVYIADPKELYVRFAQPLLIEADKSAGFTSASIYLRALAVVDAAWNPAAVVAVGLGE